MDIGTGAWPLKFEVYLRQRHQRGETNEEGLFGTRTCEVGARSRANSFHGQGVRLRAREKGGEPDEESLCGTKTHEDGARPSEDSVHHGTLKHNLNPPVRWGRPPLVIPGGPF